MDADCFDLKMNSSPKLAFIIGGAPRSGTTLLATALQKHCGVFMAQPLIPEPKIFVLPNRTSEQRRQQISQLFAAAMPNQLCGEKTSYYLESERASCLIAAEVPSAKMIFIVRDPVIRAWSNYLWSKANGMETLAFEQAVDPDLARPSPLTADKDYVRPFDYLNRGLYGRHARRWVKALGQQRIHFLKFEDLVGNPAHELDKVSAFLGIPPLPRSDTALAVVNPGKISEPFPPPAIIDSLRHFYHDDLIDFQTISGLDCTPWIECPQQL